MAGLRGREALYQQALEIVLWLRELHAGESGRDTDGGQRGPTAGSLPDAGSGG